MTRKCMRRYELLEDQWLKIAPLLPGKETDPGRMADIHLFVHAVLWIARSGAPWRDLPERYVEWNSVYVRFNRWAKKGVWKQVFEELQEPDLDWIMTDSTVVRFHHHSAGQKK
ncbi:IS5 family transposase [Catalinimonas sp. 4WD22]|uniref:IS5 family transposase n=1 Tax=Catalinimonas locisalis TaxID=3133978 RepID=UPI00310116D2